LNLIDFLIFKILMDLKIIKIFLVLLLFLCLLDMPYWYYQFVRFAAMVAFAFMAYAANEHGFKKEVLVYVALAVLFQPFVKIALGRELWNIIDVAVGVVLLLTAVKKKY
jgi:hypothetical protein